MQKVVQALQNKAVRGKVKATTSWGMRMAPGRGWGYLCRGPLIYNRWCAGGVDFTHRIGADAHGKDAAEAVTLAMILMNQPGIRAQIIQCIWEFGE